MTIVEAIERVLASGHRVFGSNERSLSVGLRVIPGRAFGVNRDDDGSWSVTEAFHGRVGPPQTFRSLDEAVAFVLDAGSSLGP